MGPEPDQSTPASSSDHADSDNSTATTYNTGKRTKKVEMEDIYVVISRKTNWHHFWKLTLPSMCILDWGSARNECCRTVEPFYMPSMMIRLARQQIIQGSLSSRQ